jgi:undecaprenyl-diphosphatase
MNFLEALDQGAAHGLYYALHAPWLTPVMKVLTKLGDPLVLLAVLLAGVAVLVGRGRPRAALVALVTAVAGFGLTHLAKEAIGRERFIAAWVKDSPTTASFPSAHALGAALVYGMLAVLLARSPRGKRWLVLGAMFLALVVGFTRMYLGMNFLTDVLGGWAAGAALAMLAVSLAGPDRKSEMAAASPV